MHPVKNGGITAAFARALANLKEAAVHMAIELKNAAFDLMAAESPKLLLE